jgi:predicted ArsR family transcriptional regulator
MDTNRIPKQAVQYKPRGQRHIGRPRKRWRDQSHFEDTRNRNQTKLFLNMMMMMMMNSFIALYNCSLFIASYVDLKINK